ncbi:flavin reductase family protein [Niveispirillum sp. BGYR6]|uniref:flavin reductase family protein n=1 Tax=Niveispirillum sp. BGYR6 TaxID=2971249 RepID=UPI0022B9A7C0|nr:flavin reductase family protein [Niveispirillum sp. BGYR6]MDG5496936.1 flavin reductase family protein [Niveispirillum sp. BGYR6]
MSANHLQPVPADDRRALRSLLGQFATGVTIVTTRAADGRKVGLTANSFTSVSLDPPLVLWCLGNNAPSMRDFLTAEHFAIHVLAEEQNGLSQHFATPSADKFAGVAHGETAEGVPVLHGTLATLLCRQHDRVEAGDHVIFIGRIERFDLAGGAPLLFHAGQYRSSAPHPARAA